MHNKKNNKGFSLVELIVVVAIMAVLVGVLAPAYLKYVENSREQKDISAVGEVVQSIKIAAANESVSKNIGNGGVTVSIVDGNAPTTNEDAAAQALQTELQSSIGKVDFSSSALNGQTVKIVVSMDGTGALSIVTSCDEVDDSKYADVKTELGKLK